MFLAVLRPRGVRVELSYFARAGFFTTVPVLIVGCLVLSIEAVVVG